MQRTVFLSVALFVALAAADCYLHNPRGSNNRWKTQNDNEDVQNDQRLFNSQNNAQGGYDNCRTEGSVTPLQFIAGSKLPVQWSVQHGCGKNSWVNCEIILQFMCSPPSATAGSRDEVRDGNSNDRIDFTDGLNGWNNVDLGKGMHEPWYHYYSCVHRRRNKGLFTADRQVNGENADFTRQNNNNNRRGYECQEERDYYPYWAPSPWIDFAILIDDVSRCPAMQMESENIKGRKRCQHRTVKAADGNPSLEAQNLAIDQQDCESGNNNLFVFADTPANLAPWLTTNKNIPFWGGNDEAVRCAGKTGQELTDCRKLLGTPDCVETRWGRENHLGNVQGGFLANYTWAIPDFPSKSCVLRIRYNISTDDYNPFTTNAAYNQKLNEKGSGKSPVEQDEYFKWAWDYVPLQLAIDTSQYGRTFEDRSHVFSIVSRTGQYTLLDGVLPPGLTSPVTLNIGPNEVIHNVNVRGKRGHYSQVFPSVPMDFVPQYLHIKVNDWVHFQWEGASTGVFGYFGGGTPRSERSNIVPIENMKSNWPLTGAAALKMFGGDQDLQTHFATAGQSWVNQVVSVDKKCSTLTSLLNDKIVPPYRPTDSQDVRFVALAKLREQTTNCAWLNLARATFFSLPIQFKEVGAHYYMSTRNNMPGIQSHKAAIFVNP